MVMAVRNLWFVGDMTKRVPIRNVWLEGCSEQDKNTEQTRASAETSGFGWTARIDQEVLVGHAEKSAPHG